MPSRPSLTRIALPLGLIALAAAPAAARDRAAAATRQTAPRLDRSHAGRPAPAATFADHAGAKHRLAEFRGRPLLVNLWASWCAPCLAELPALDRFAARNRGLAVLAVSQDLGGWRAADKVFGPAKYPALRPYLDRENDLAIALGSAGLPTTVLYDANGLEVWRAAGPVDWDRLGPMLLK